MTYVADVIESWPDSQDETSRTIGLAFTVAEGKIAPVVTALNTSDTTLVDSQETRRYIGEMICGAACMQLLLNYVPDTIRKPARLTIITMLKTWTKRAVTNPVSLSE